MIRALPRLSLLAAAALLCAASPAWAIDWKTITPNLPDDTKAMRDRYVYFDANTTARDVGLDKPVLILADVQAWISQRIAETLKLVPLQYDQQIVVSQRHFTPKGYGQYITSLQAAQIPMLIKEQRYQMSALVTNPPHIFATGQRDEGGDPNAPGYVKKMTYVWQVETPVLISYVDGGKTSTYKVFLTTEITRIPMRDDATLIAINSWSFSDRERHKLR